jgi:hypothetical protein
VGHIEKARFWVHNRESAAELHALIAVYEKLDELIGVVKAANGARDE